jgi:exoribonuclease-2
MTADDDHQTRSRLQRIARRVMVERGLVPDFSSQALAELARIAGPAIKTDPNVRDLRKLLWCSIDNDDSRDLDQLTVAEALPDGGSKLLVAIADVDALVKRGSALDEHARRNTTSVYTAAMTFPMLPERLSTDLTSLNGDTDRLAMVVEMTFDAQATLTASNVYQGLVRNRAKLAYDSTAAWLDSKGTMPKPIGAVSGLDDNLRLQDRVAHQLKAARHAAGSLDLETIQARPVFADSELIGLEREQPNRAKDLIADFMIAANGVVARFLATHQFASLRRVVRTPKRWDRIVELAAEHGTKLPAVPDPRPLEQFLASQRAADPDRFPDLSLSIIKLLGPGEYVVQIPGHGSEGHFGLAVRDYTHSTAPNRRYPDVVTQRLLKAALVDRSSPYPADELAALAKHCTDAEDAARKVERQVGKSAAALLLEGRIGEQFDAVVTGATQQGIWVRIAHPAVEGKLVQGSRGLDVGHKLRVELLRTDVEHGHIDFQRAV